MITSVFDIELDGVKYVLDKVNTADTYVRQRVPMRALNSQVVQGETTSEFN